MNKRLLRLIILFLLLNIITVFLYASSGMVIMDVKGNFYPSGWMGDYDDISFDEKCTSNPHTGVDCIKIAYTARNSNGNGWAGINWQYPDKNWGDDPGYRDLHYATKLSFWAKGENGGEKAEFKVGGTDGKYKDSVLPALTTGSITLTSEWKEYTIDLSNSDLRHMIAGFCWVTSVGENPNGCTVYIDDARYIRDNTTVSSKEKPLYGLNFSPYLESQSPNFKSKISEDQIKLRLELVKPYTQWIRTFSCTNGLENIGKIAHKMGLKTLVGAWIGKNNAENEKEIAAVIKVAKAGDADIVAVGNEVLLRGDLKEKSLIEYITRVKNEVKKVNPKIKVTTVDGYSFLLKHPNVIKACDLILINCYPFWEGCRFEDSIASLDKMYEKTKSAAKGKEVVISESGWPSSGNTIGKAVPSEANGLNYLKNFLAWAKSKNVKYFYFTGFDESWKEAEEGILGGHWGIFNNNGILKYKLDIFKDIPLSTIPAGYTLSIDGIYIPSGYMGNTKNIKMETIAVSAANKVKHQKITLLKKNQSEWAGVYWQYPQNNWGSEPGLGLFYPRKLTFKVKGEFGGEKVEFKAGGISGDYVDSINPAVGTGEVILTNEWKTYTINLEGKGPLSLIGGFCCMANSQSNPEGCVIRLADIKYVW